MQRILCFLRNRMMLCFLRNRVILCFSKKQSDTIIISASVSPVIVHYCNNKKKLFIHCLWDAFADDRPSETDLWNCLHSWNGFEDRYE